MEANEAGDFSGCTTSLRRLMRQEISLDTPSLFEMNEQGVICDNVSYWFHQLLCTDGYSAKDIRQSMHLS